MGQQLVLGVDALFSRKSEPAPVAQYPRRAAEHFLEGTNIDEYIGSKYGVEALGFGIAQIGVDLADG